MPPCFRPSIACLGLIATVLGSGVLLGLLWMLASPASYVALTDRLAWRMAWPDSTQIRLEDTTTRLHLRGDALVRQGDILLFGDSHLHGLPASALPRTSNYAIGGETAERLAQRLPRYGSVQRAGLVILLTGRNDLVGNAPPITIARAYDQIMQDIPAATPMITLAIPPGIESPAKLALLDETNRLLAARCRTRAGCEFLALDLADAEGKLAAAYDAGDGIHLNTAGYQLLQAAIAKALPPAPSLAR